MKTKYCLGFLVGGLFDPMVVLIKKNRPAWQSGLLNGVGGKVEEGEHPGAAMTREFSEETGVTIRDWTPFAEMIFTDCDVYCFVAVHDDLIFAVESKTDEEVGVYKVNSFGHRIPNLAWLIPMALSRLGEPKQGIIRLEHL